MVPIKVIHVNLGRTDFAETWKLQKEIMELKKSGSKTDIILSTEHEHVYTLGKSGDRDHLLLDETQLKLKEIAYYEIDRGGDLTYHGPGQIVVYPIFDLHNYYLDTHRYLRDLEQAVILTLQEYGIEAGRDEEFTGVWVRDEKISAIGIKVSRWITMHGLAFNINTDLSYFGNIIPCGIFHKGVTSMAKLLGREIDMNKVNQQLIQNLLKTFGISKMEEVSSASFKEKYLSAIHT